MGGLWCQKQMGAKLRQIIRPEHIWAFRDSLEVGWIVEVDAHGVYDGKSAGSAYQGKKRGRIVEKYRRFFIMDCGEYKRCFTYVECLVHKTDFHIISKKTK